MRGIIVDEILRLLISFFYLLFKQKGKKLFWSIKPFLMQRGGSVYIMTNKIKTTLYIGVTSNLPARIQQHKEHVFQNSFSDKYNLEKCIYYQNYSMIEEAIDREKQIKKWRREKKEELIKILNPYWEDLWEKEIKFW